MLTFLSAVSKVLLREHLYSYIQSTQKSRVFQRFDDFYPKTIFKTLHIPAERVTEYLDRLLGDFPSRTSFDTLLHRWVKQDISELFVDQTSIWSERFYSLAIYGGGVSNVYFWYAQGPRSNYRGEKALPFHQLKLQINPNLNKFSFAVSNLFKITDGGTFGKKGINFVNRSYPVLMSSNSDSDEQGFELFQIALAPVILGIVSVPHEFKLLLTKIIGTIDWNSRVPFIKHSIQEQLMSKLKLMINKQNPRWNLNFGKK